MTLNLWFYLAYFILLMPIIEVKFMLSSSIDADHQARARTFQMGLRLVLSLFLFIYFYNHQKTVSSYFLKGDALAFMMTSLIIFVSFVVHQFSIRYMAGGRQYSKYFLKLSLLTSSCTLMALADDLCLFFISWFISNAMLISLMIHQSAWKAALNSGILAAQTLCLGACFFIIAIGLIYYQTGNTSITDLNQCTQNSRLLSTALYLIVFTALTQSAIFPFHRWLMSSLNSPTPISALMHAGLVNGGGFLLIRLAPLLKEDPLLLKIIFLMGAYSAIVGTVWKLIQTDVKRMLASSTLSQMGFMMMQCGLGLFSAAMAHLIWHGLFKAFLFLNSGAALEKNPENQIKNTASLSQFIISVFYGVLGTYFFTLITAQNFLIFSNRSFLLFFVFIAMAQVAQVIMVSQISRFKKTMVFVSVSFFAGIYGFSIKLIETAMPIWNNRIGPLGSLEIAVLLVFLLLWLGFNLNALRWIEKTKIWKIFYLFLLNSSQPHPKTSTPIRQSYQY